MTVIPRYPLGSVYNNNSGRNKRSQLYVQPDYIHNRNRTSGISDTVDFLLYMVIQKIQIDLSLVRHTFEITTTPPLTTTYPQSLLQAGCWNPPLTPSIPPRSQLSAASTARKTATRPATTPPTLDAVFAFTPSDRLVENLMRNI